VAEEGWKRKEEKSQTIIVLDFGVSKKKIQQGHTNLEEISFRFIDYAATILLPHTSTT
jgi:hypothetical protein